MIAIILPARNTSPIDAISAAQELLCLQYLLCLLEPQSMHVLKRR